VAAEEARIKAETKTEAAAAEPGQDQGESGETDSKSEEDGPEPSAP